MDPLPVLERLVAASSVNPSLVPGAPGEADAAAVAADALRAAGLDVVVEDAAPGRPNVIGVAEGREPGPSVMLCGHLDTVGVEGMTDPFVPRIEDGRLYGRGAQDMKGGVAAMIAAAAVVARSITRGRVIVACVADEEFMSAGAEALVRGWRADMAIVTEPTDMRVAIGHKGFAWFAIETIGRAAHGSRPRDGRDAVAHMGRVLAGIEALDRDLQSRPPHPILGTGSIHASTIAGGRELSTYPDRCTLQLERRAVLGEDDGVVERELADILAALARADPDFDARLHRLAYRPAYLVDRESPIVRAAVAAVDKSGRDATPIGMSFWTDAAILSHAGIPTVLFGPGGAGLHGAVEYVHVDDVRACRDVLVETVTGVLSGRFAARS